MPMQGQVLQLDPALDLDAFGLTPAARCIARALQEFGAVAVDGAHGNVIVGWENGELVIEPEAACTSRARLEKLGPMWRSSRRED